VLTQFGYLLSHLQYTLPALPDDAGDAASGAINEFLDDHIWRDYEGVRSDLMAFCLRSALSPEAVADRTGVDTFIQQIMADLPLRCVCWASRLFGA